MAKAATATATNLSVDQQRRRTERCEDCNGWGFIAGHTPMKICHCVVRTEHLRPGKAPSKRRAPDAVQRPELNARDDDAGGFATE
jgi:hypothetical protein